MGNELLEVMPCKVLEVREVETTQGKRMKVKMVMSRADEKNANNRIYRYGLLEREVGKVKDRLSKGETIFMQADHPHNGQPSVPDTVAILKNAEISPSSKEVVGEAIILNTSKGKDLAEIIRAGGAPGVSSRGYGSIKPGEVNGVSGDVVDEDYKLITWDFVIGQSTPGAVVTNFQEQARLRELAEGDAMDLKDATVADLKSARPDLVKAIEDAAENKPGETEQIKKAVAAQTVEIEKGLRAEFEKKLAEVRPKEATPEEVEQIVRKWATDHKMKLVAEADGGTGNVDQKAQEEIATLKAGMAEQKRLTESALQKITQLTELTNQSSVASYIVEKTKDVAVGRASMIARLTESCKTREEVDARFKMEEEFVKKIIEEAKGAGHVSNEEPIGFGGKDEKKVTLANGKVLTESQVAMRKMAGLTN